MKFTVNFYLRFCSTLGAVVLLGFLSAATPIFGDSWSRTLLGQGGMVLDSAGFAIPDIYGDVLPLLPTNYKPSAVVTAAGLNVLRVSSQRFSPPPVELDSHGFPLLDDYFRFDYGVLNGNAWTVEEPVDDWLTDVQNPYFVSRMDDALSVYYCKENSIYIATPAAPNPTLLTISIFSEKGTVAIDANGGVHVLSINAAYELWHRYYDSTSLVAIKLSSGPVCDVVAVAGENDACHVAYTTFSEDLNLNEVLDDGEDLNGNSILDDVAHQVIYQSIDGGVPAVAETVVDALSPVCHFDLLFSASHGLRMVYADPLSNAIRMAKRYDSGWLTEQVSSMVGPYGPLALGIHSNGDCVVSFATQDGFKLGLVEERSGAWTQALIRETAVGAYFTGTDVVVRVDGEVVVLAAEKNVGAYLAAYTESALPALLPTQTQPISIRSAFIVSWPAPGDSVVEQVLQSTSDLADPESWVDVEQKYWYSGEERAALETVVEQDAQKFYRVLEISE